MWRQKHWCACAIQKHFFSQKPILSVSQTIGLDLVDNWRKFNKTTRIHFFPYWFWCFFSNKQIIKFLWEWNNRACFSRAIASQWSTDINNVVNNYLMSSPFLPKNLPKKKIIDRLVSTKCSCFLHFSPVLYLIKHRNVLIPAL